MKKIINSVVLVAFVALIFSCNSSTKEPEENNASKLTSNITLTGNFINSSQETIVLCFLPVGGEKIIDSCKIDANGNFEFNKLHIPGIGFYTLKLSNQNFAPLILDENQKVKVIGDAKSLGYTYSTEGSTDTKIFQDISEMSMFHKTLVDSLGSDFQEKIGINSKNKKLFEELSQKYEGVYNNINNEFYKQLLTVVNANPKSLASITAVAQLDPSVYIDIYINLDKNLQEKYPTYASVTTFHEQVLKYGTLAIGSQAPDLIMQDASGASVSLSSLKGKVVMLDFWASWCKPCRKENPTIVKMYKKYKSKGFEILGVSLDENKDDWIRAISTDDLNWIHVCDFGGWYSNAAKTYDVTSIPYTLLIDKNGRIISKGLRGEILEKRLIELLNS